MKSDRIKVIQSAPYQAESGNGVYEYVYQLTRLLKDQINFEFFHFSSVSFRDVQVEEKDGFIIRIFPASQLKGIILPRLFKEWIKTLNPKQTVFHLHSVFYPPNFAIARELKKQGFAFIHTPHDSYSPESMVKNRFMKRVYMVLLERYVLASATQIHALTETGRKHISKYTRNSSITLVTNFVSPFGENRIVKKRTQLSFIGRYDIHQKGIDIMLKALSRYKAAGHNPVPFVLIGKYNREEELLLTSLINRNGLTHGNVVMKGKVSTEEKNLILAESRFYFQLSRFEGFGLAIVEALAAGTPVIITNKVPIWQTIAAFNAGYVVTNIEEAVSALDGGLSLSDTAYAEMCENAIRCYSENFHPAIVKPKLINMYEKTLKLNI